MKVYFENVRFYHYLLVKYYLLQKFDVCMFDFDSKARKKRWLRNFIDNNDISRVTPYVLGNSSLALDNIERAYNLVAQKSRLVKAMEYLYDDKNITLAYKKTLVKHLSDFYAVQIILNNEEKMLPDNEKITFIPFRYLEILKILTQCKAFSYKLEKVFIPCWLRHINDADKCFNRLNNWMRFLLCNFWSIGLTLLKILGSSHKKDIYRYQYAIPITNPNFQFRFKEHRTFDFLLDGTNIKKSNTVFLLLSPLDGTISDRLRAQNYNVVDLVGQNILISNEFPLGKSGRIILRKVFLYTLQSFLSALFEYDFNILCSRGLLNTYLHWNVILNNIKFRHYITLNDEAIGHIGRNIILNNFNIKTWYYAHSASLGAMTTTNDIDIIKRRDWLWSFLFYDYYIGWNRKVIEYQKLHHQNIKNYCNIGCLWSEFIANNGAIQSLNSYLKKQGIKKHNRMNENSKVVSFFDTSFFDGVASQYPLKDGITFYNDILKLLDEEPNLFIVIKEKKTVMVYSDKASLVYSRSNKEYSKLLSVLKTHPRCYISGYNADPTAITKVSNLTVTYAFSSSTIEALGARKKAIFYDPASKFRGYYYDEFPDLVAHGYEELRHLIRKLLYETSDKEYEEYLDREILHKIEDYLDGKALTRFRALLTKS